MPFTPLNGLHAFTVVARRASFSAAARELGVSPSALSQAVRQLEERLGVVLLARTTRSVAPTKAGLRLLEASGAALDQALEGLRTVTHETGELTGMIRLTVPERVTERVFAPLLSRFLAAHPRVTFELSVESRQVDIVRDGFDAGVRAEGIPKDMVRLRLADPFRIVVAGSPSYFARYGEPKKPEDLVHHRCIGMDDPSCPPSGWDFERGKKSWRIPVVPVVTCNERNGRTALAEAGVGLVRTVDIDASVSQARGTLRIVLDDYAPRVGGSFLYYPNRRQASHAFRAFVEMLKRRTGA
jgi:DNA-binding transcriptional LysR family regulator